MNIPSKFRKVLLDMQEDRLVVTKFILNSFRCLDVYPQSEWDRFEEELAAKPRFDENFLKLEHFYLSSAEDCSLDKQGRILLPPLLREYAGLTKDVMFTGARKKFRIWDKEIWKKLNTESERDLSQNPNLFSSLNI